MPDIRLDRLVELASWWPQLNSGVATLREPHH